MNIWIGIAIVIGILLVICIVRAIQFQPKEQEISSIPETPFDHDQAIAHLQTLIRIPTVSNAKEELCDAKVFETFRTTLKQLYPTVASHCTYHECGHSGICFHWKGESSEEPTVLMAHYDVVPVGDRSLWKEDPFAGVIKENVLWGRGTLDTKITLFGVMESCETMLKKGYTPKQDIWMCFSGNEEVAGQGADSIVDYLISQNVKPALVVDEGGAIVENLFPSVTKPIAVIGTGEKGMADIQFTCKGKGGHASQPPKHTALGELAQAIADCENHPFKARFTKPVYQLLDAVGRHASFGFKLIFANMWLFQGLLLTIFKKSGGDLSAMVQTTQAFTMANASPQSNVLPSQATAIANLRLLDTTDEALEHLRHAIHNDNITVEKLYGNNATPFTDVSSQGYQKVSDAIRRTWKNTIVSPYIMMACSDSRHYCRICDTVCRFSCMRLTKEQRSLIHNANERIELPMIIECVQFYLNLVATL